MATTKVQVEPQAGSVKYQLVITGADLSGMLFGVGQLLGSGSAGTRLVNITAFTGASASVPVSLVSMNTWDDGIRFYTQPLTWDGGAQALSLVGNLNGESEFAFLRVAESAVPVTKLSFDIPTGYNAGAGDAVEFAFAIPVPEPGQVFLLAIGVPVLAGYRRRSLTPK